MGTKLNSLKWHQVHAWRLAQQYLSPRLNSQDTSRAVPQVVSRTGGIQAQVMSAAELALFIRVEGLRAEDIKAALWQDRTLAKTWAMRGTLHVLAASDLPLYVAARSFHDSLKWSTYFGYYGFTPEQQEAFLSAVPQVLGKEPMTRETLAITVASRAGDPRLRELILSSGWGLPLKPSAFRGDLCFGPNQGQHVTFVNPRTWIRPWPSIEPRLAIREIARRYLQAYGPAKAEDFARWWWGNGGIVQAKRLFRSMEDELEEVDIEGWRAHVLRASLERMQRLELSDTVQLLPLFDAYTIGMPRDLEPLLAQAHKSHVFRPQGWISAVVLVNGSIQGVWRSTIRRSQVVVKVHLFSSPAASIRKGIEANVARLGDFFKTNVLLEYEHPSYPSD